MITIDLLSFLIRFACFLTGVQGLISLWIAAGSMAGDGDGDGEEVGLIVFLSVFSLLNLAASFGIIWHLYAV